MRLTKFYISVVTEAKKILEARPEKHYTASELSQLTGVGSSQLKRAFKQQVGVGIYAYQLKQRMEGARRLIEEDDITLKNIARKAGFKALSNFTTAFRKEFGITPGQYRNKMG